MCDVDDWTALAALAASMVYTAMSDLAPPVRSSELSVCVKVVDDDVVVDGCVLDLAAKRRSMSSSDLPLVSGRKKYTKARPSAHHVM